MPKIKLKSCHKLKNAACHMQKFQLHFVLLMTTTTMLLFLPTSLAWEQNERTIKNAKQTTSVSDDGSGAVGSSDSGSRNASDIISNTNNNKNLISNWRSSESGNFMQTSKTNITTTTNFYAISNQSEASNNGQRRPLIINETMKLESNIVKHNRTSGPIMPEKQQQREQQQQTEQQEQKLNFLNNNTQLFNNNTNTNTNTKNKSNNKNEFQSKIELKALITTTATRKTITAKNNNNNNVNVNNKTTAAIDNQTQNIVNSHSNHNSSSSEDNVSVKSIGSGISDVSHVNGNQNKNAIKTKAKTKIKTPSVSNEHSDVSFTTSYNTTNSSSHNTGRSSSNINEYSEINNNNNNNNSNKNSDEDTQILWNWKFNRTKVKRILRNRRNETKKALLSNFGLWQQHNLKVNQVFESERRMTRGHIQRNRGKIVLLGLFELTTKLGPRPDGLSELSAALMAVEHINKKKLLPGYTLELVTNDTQCDPGVGVDRFFHAIYTQPTTRMVMLLGSACSEVTESLAKVAPYWNIVQVSFGSTSPALSDRQEFPYFYRTVAPDSSHNPARIAFIRRFGWDTVTTFSQNEEVHSLAVNDLVTELEAANISCAATITFAATDFKEQLLLLRETDTRIIIGSFSQDLAPGILCEAYRLRMFGADYAWILHESMGAPWWNSPYDAIPSASASTYCSAAELQEAVENLIIVSSHNSIVGNNISLSGLNNDMFYSQLHKQFVQFQSLAITHAIRKHSQSSSSIKVHANQPNEFNSKSSSNFSSSASSTKTTTSFSRYAPQTYDAVWAIALALRGAEEHWRKDAIQSKLDRFDYTRSDMAWEFLHQLGKLDFLGVSGPVSFSGPDRVGTTAFYQIQNGTLEPIALYYPAENELDFECPHCKIVKWHSGQVPIAKRIFKLRVATIAPLAFYTIATVSSVGIALAIAFLAFNLHFRKLKAIKLSSPKLSNITAVGCICVYTAVILLGLDYSTLPAAEDSFSTVCTARVYLLSAGFSLAFGSMFAKTYRVHRIFTRTGSVFKDKMLQDIQLILLVCGLLLVDGLVVTLWVVTDPMERHLHNLTLEISSIDRSVVYQPQVEVCRSQHTQTWLGLLYAYKGLLLIVGVYMAWETRHVKIAALNDSQYIGVSVYSVVITSCIVVVLANLISERVTLAFITITAFILTSTTATLCLLFIPKIHDILARNDIIDPVIHSMGLKMECNTRRFVIDERQELQYRVQVQNRVYKKEIAALDAEIRKLERILEAGTASTTSSSTSLMVGMQKPEVTITSDTSIHILPPSSVNVGKSRTPSISGILPNLLLSVLPPVIPRASWPSAEYMQIPMRRSVTFASQPQLEDTLAAACLPAQDLYNLRLAHQQATETKTGFINRIRGIFSRTQSSNKGSTASLSEQKGLKAAFKSHMGLFTRLIPSSQTASCNAIYNNGHGTAAGGGEASNEQCAAGASTASGSNNFKPMHRLSFAKSGTHLDVTTADPSFLRIPTISAEMVDATSSNSIELATTTDFSVGKYIKAYEPKVNFQLPANRRPSIVSQMQVQPTLRERVRGSPRFPHRILPPTCSLSALEEAEDRSGGGSASGGGVMSTCVDSSTARSLTSAAIKTTSTPRMTLQRAAGVGNWKSMEVTGKSRLSLSDSKEELSKDIVDGAVAGAVDKVTVIADVTSNDECVVTTAAAAATTAAIAVDDEEP